MAREPKHRFSLNPLLDRDALAHEYRTTGRVQLAPFLAEADATLLLEHLRSRADWRLVINSRDKVFEIDRAGQAALTPAKREAMDRLVHAEAQAGFQFRFESLRVADDHQQRRSSGTLLDEFADFMCSEGALGLLRAVTGKPQIAFSDAQGTCYSPGHFLNRHDDDVAGKHRMAAYVLGLTPGWDADWGGLLLFHRDKACEALRPQFNVLTVFQVPQPHSVTMVAPFAGGSRYSVTGWLRSSRPA